MSVSTCIYTYNTIRAAAVTVVVTVTAGSCNMNNW